MSDHSSSLDAIADQFEAAWRDGETPPEIGRSLVDADDGKRDQLLIELIKLDMECRAKYAEPKALEEYLEEWPELKGEDGAAPKELVETSSRIESHYRDTMKLGGAASQSDAAQVRCPYCAALVEVPKESSEAEGVTCSSCSSPFRWDPVTTRGTDPVSLPDAIGKYQVLSALGRGAFGVVYKAKDTELNRVVALKAPRSGDFSSEEEKERFLREARSAAGLSHPGIVEVHDVSHEGGTTCIVCEFVDGLSLAELLTGPRLDHNRVAEILAAAADALDYAHQAGIIHRDIKPHNILIDKAGKPYLADFGLARNEDEDVTITQSGQIFGTPAYMSPEQAEGDQKKIGPASDIYSLGAMMYEMLTGDLPFRGSRRMLLYQILNEEPVPPRRINDRIPRDLDTICLKALSKEPEKRYTSAGDMATDLRRWLNGEPVLARPVSSTERFARWCKRNPRVAGLSAVVFLMAVGIAIVSTVSAMRLSVANEKIATERDAKDAAIRKQRQDALDSSEALAMQAVRAAEEVRWGEAEIRADFSKKLLIDGPWGDYALGMLAWKKNDFGSAEEHLRTALMNDPSHQLSKDGLAQVLVMSGQLNKAEELIAKTAHKGDWQAVRAAGKALFRAERYRQAEKAFAKALELISKVQASANEEKDWGKLLARADGFLASERFPEAKATLEKAIEILKSKGGVAPEAMKKAREKLRFAEKELEALKQDLEYAKDDANAWIKCEGFEQSLRGLSAEAQWQRIQQKLEDLHGQPVIGQPAILVGTIRYVSHFNNISWLRYLQPLKGLSLTNLECGNTKVSDLSSLRGMPLSNLNISHTGVSDLSPIEGMPLKNLTLNGTLVKELTALKGMPLESLNFAYTDVSDLVPLKGLPLSSLSFSRTRVRDIVSLKDSPLTSLAFEHTEVADLSPLKGMKLRLLKCAFTKVQDLSPIAGMPLEELTWYWYSWQKFDLKDLSLLKGMPLKHLAIDGSFTDLSPLKDAPLTHLAIGSENVNDLSPLKGTQLTYLSIYGTKVKDLSPLEGMPLNTLLCHDVEATDFSPLKDMKLRELMCGNAALRNWSIFRDMPLEGLSIISDRLPYVTDLSLLRGMKLKRFRCGSKNLVDIVPLIGMPLTDLDLDSTQVSDLTPLKGMPLEKLKLSHTPAADLTPLEGMKLKVFHPPEKDLLTPASLKLIEEWKKQGCNVVWK